MSLVRTAVCLLCCLVLAAGCNSGPRERPTWPELDTQDAPDTDVQAPPWYKPSEEPEPWPLGPEPKYATDEWRQWCAVRYNSRAVVRRVEQAPTIDGTLDDAAWQDAAVKPPFMDSVGNPAEPSTALYLACDDENLYLAARAELSAVKDKPGAQDYVSITLAPDWTVEKPDLYAFFVNSKDLIAARRNTDLGWGAKTEAAVTADDESWSFELAVPLDAFGVSADELWGRVWACRADRIRYSGTLEFSSWTRLLDADEGTSNWGHVIFRGVKPPEPEPPAAPETSTNDETKPETDNVSE